MIYSPWVGRWQVRCSLLNLGQSEILLCEREGDFAVIERFRRESPYAAANGDAEILLQGRDAGQLIQDFSSSAQHTFEFMASNLVAKAQKVAFEQYPQNEPGRVVRAISHRCLDAIGLKQDSTLTLTVEQPRQGRGMRI
ncbi:MAG: hypothetical protein L0Z50_32820 [Verrucomicrobiales bacterium]|nr:hypothetical protein [Verrucomicrobiales bacterium]